MLLLTRRRTSRQADHHLLSALKTVDLSFALPPLADLHPVPTITAGRLATTPPPPSGARAGIFAPRVGLQGTRVPQFQQKM